VQVVLVAERFACGIIASAVSELRQWRVLTTAGLDRERKTRTQLSVCSPLRALLLPVLRSQASFLFLITHPRGSCI
jgi:hypothetical protein